MKFSKLAQTYDEIQKAQSDPQRVRILAAAFSSLDQRTLEAVAHFTVGEVVDPQLSDKLGIGPGTIRFTTTSSTGRRLFVVAKRRTLKLPSQNLGDLAFVF